MSCKPSQRCTMQRAHLSDPAMVVERVAIRYFFTAINQRDLTLPRDPNRLPLRFKLQPL